MRRRYAIIGESAGQAPCLYTQDGEIFSRAARSPAECFNSLQARTHYPEWPQRAQDRIAQPTRRQQESLTEARGSRGLHALARELVLNQKGMDSRQDAKSVFARIRVSVACAHVRMWADFKSVSSAVRSTASIPWPPSLLPCHLAVALVLVRLHAQGVHVPIPTP